MDWMIYGANGYTGELIAREAKSRGGTPVLAGRSASKVTALAKELRLSPKVFALDLPAGIVEALRGIRLVLNCAGPFPKTAGPLMRACMSAKADYLDITGKIEFSKARIVSTRMQNRQALSYAQVPASTWCRPTASL